MTTKASGYTSGFPIRLGRPLLLIQGRLPGNRWRGFPLQEIVAPGSRAVDESSGLGFGRPVYPNIQCRPESEEVVPERLCLPYNVWGQLVPDILRLPQVERKRKRPQGGRQAEGMPHRLRVGRGTLQPL